MLRKKLKTKKNKKKNFGGVYRLCLWVYANKLYIYSEKQKLYYHDFAIPFFL